MFEKIKAIRIPEGNMKSLSISGTLLWQKQEQLTAPIISLDGDTLEIWGSLQDNPVAELVIFVDGVETATVEV